MTPCVMVYWRNRRFYRIPDAEVEDWEELLDSFDGAPQLIEQVADWPPYTHAYRLPDGVVYLVALKSP